MLIIVRYVYRHKPVVMRGCMHTDGLPDKWTDQYFMSFEEIRTWKPIVETVRTQREGKRKRKRDATTHTRGRTGETPS